MRSSCGIFFLGLALLAGCSDPAHEPAKPDPAVQPSVLEKTRAEMDAQSHVPPDRRFVLAACDIQAILSGDSPQEGRSTLRDGAWILSCGEDEVGRLAELPDFDDALMLLVAWSRRQEKLHPLGLTPAVLPPIQEAWADFPNRSALDELRKLDAEWKAGQRDALSLHRAAQALILLALSAPGAAGFADPLDARTLAVFALDRALNGEAWPEQALLTKNLGYSASARRAVRALPEDNPIRAFLFELSSKALRFEPDLEASPLTQWLFLLRMTEENCCGSQLVHGLLRRSFGTRMTELPILARWDESADLEHMRSMSIAAPWLLLLDAARAAGSAEADALAEGLKLNRDDPELLFQACGRISKELGVSEGALLPRLEQEIAKLDASDGPFLRGPILSSYYWSTLSALLYRGLSYYLDSLGAADAAEPYLDSLGTPASSFGKEWMHWARDLTLDGQGKAKPGQLAADLETFQELSPSLLECMFSRAQEQATDEVATRKLSHEFIKRLDSRIGERCLRMQVAELPLLDLQRMERLAESMAEQWEPSGNNGIWYSIYMGREDSLLELVQDPRQSSKARVKALDYFREAGRVKPEDLDEFYERLVQDHPDNRGLREVYADWLGSRKQYDQARKLLSDWLQENPDAPNLEPVFALTKIASLYYDEGLYQEAWDTIEPAVQSWQRGAMLRGALILVELGRAEEAEELARAMLDRYPMPESLASTAEILWRLGRNEAAAQLLMHPPRAFPKIHWGWHIGHGFSRAFAKRPVERAMAAVEELKRLNLDTEALHIFANSLGSDGLDELSFRVQSSIQLPRSLDASLRILLNAHAVLARAKGQAIGLAWLRPKLTPPLLNRLPMDALFLNDYPLVWLPDDPEPENKGKAMFWLWRAAATLMDGGAKNPNWPRLLAYYQAAPRDHYHRIGRYLVGLEDEKALMELGTNADKACEVAAYIGIRKQAERRYDEAAYWYQIALATGASQNMEYSWASDVLLSWQRKNMNLKRLAQQGS